MYDVAIVRECHTATVPADRASGFQVSPALDAILVENVLLGARQHHHHLLDHDVLETYRAGGAIRFLDDVDGGWLGLRQSGLLLFLGTAAQVKAHFPLKLHQGLD